MGAGGPRRRLAVKVIAAGLGISLVMLAAFHFLLATASPTAPVNPGSSASLKDWVNAYSAYSSAYAKWQSSQAAYTAGFGISLLAALGFVVAFGVVLAPKLAFLTSISLLHIHFAWTSHLLSDVSKPLDAALGKVIAAQASFFWNTADVGGLFPPHVQDSPMNMVLDLEMLAVLGIMMASVFLLCRRQGTRTAFLRALQIAALCLTVLGLEIAVFDQAQLSVHVTQMQVFLKFAPWFTNANLLYSALAVLAVSTLLLRAGRPKL